MKRAIEYEAKRLIELVENGEQVVQQTRSFDASNGTTFALRTKEEANDYRYFADPDLVPFRISSEMLAEIKSQIPELPEEKSLRYTKQYQLTEYDAAILTDEKETAAYFEQVLAELDLSDIARAKAAANWMMGPVKSFLNENNLSIADFPVKPVTIAQLISLIETGKLNFSSASSRLFNALCRSPVQILHHLLKN